MSGGGIDFMALVPSSVMMDEVHDRRIEKARAEEAAEEERKKKREVLQHLADCGCPIKDLRRAISGELIETKALAATRASVERGDELLVLSGPRGLGKTTAAAWWLCQPRRRCEFVSTTAVRFVDAGLLSRWPRYDNTKMRELTRCRALVIDDLGIEFSDTKGAFVSLFDEVVNNRYASELPTMITTNLVAKAFKSRFGERVADRVRESGKFIALNGESLRGRDA